MTFGPAILLFLVLLFENPLWAGGTKCPAFLQSYSLALVAEVGAKILPDYTAAGYTEIEAIRAIDELIHLAYQASFKASTQSQLASQMGGVGAELYPNDATSLLPVFVHASVPSFNSTRWMEAIVSGHDDWGGIARPALRHFGLWHTPRDPLRSAKILRAIPKVDSTATSAFTVHYDRLFEAFKDHPDVLYWIESYLTKSGMLVGPLSTVPIQDLPNGLKDEVQKRIRLEDPPLLSDAVVGVKHAVYAGTCMFMQLHRNVLDSKDPYYGQNVLIYVDGNLVGSMKMKGGASILGLRNVQNNSGKFPMVVGGVYSTTWDVIELAREAFQEQGKGARIDVPSLPVRPLIILGHEEAPADAREMGDTLIESRQRLENPNKKSPVLRTLNSQ